MGGFMKVGNEIDKSTELAQWDNVTNDQGISTFSFFEDIKRGRWLRSWCSGHGLQSELWDNVKVLHISEEMVRGVR
jgi:hypothetical protein